MSYNITLLANMERFTTEGEARILVKVVRSTETVAFHVYPGFLKVDHRKARVHRVNSSAVGKEVKIEGCKKNIETQMYWLTLEQKVDSGSMLELMLPFTGRLIGLCYVSNCTYEQKKEVGNDIKQSGFYLSGDGMGGLMGVTQFQPMFARQAFPCFDEPHLKAKFTLKLGRPKEFKTRSNTRAVKVGEDVEGRLGYVWDRYATTPVMSTYLLAWVIFKMESSKSERGRGVAVEAFHYDVASSQNAADSAADLLDIFEEIFGITYTLDKMDMVAVPFFKWGGMENWGMSTYAKEYMQGTNFVIAHEMVKAI